jgi:hypothetical protein
MPPPEPGERRSVAENLREERGISACESRRPNRCCPLGLKKVCPIPNERLIVTGANKPNTLLLDLTT